MSSIHKAVRRSDIHGRTESGRKSEKTFKDCGTGYSQKMLMQVLHHFGAQGRIPAIQRCVAYAFDTSSSIFHPKFDTLSGINSCYLLDKTNFIEFQSEASSGEWIYCNST